MQVPFLELSRLNAHYKDAYLAEVDKLYDMGNLIGSAANPYNKAFEEAFAAYCGAAHCVGVSNGLDALVLALRALEIGAGDEVIVPAQTFIATWLAVSQVGATPVAVDVESRSANVDADLVELAITPQTKAIIAVHLHGYMADMKELRRIADAHGLKLIEDSAQAHGCTRDGKRAGAWGDVAAFSFYPAKNLGAFGDAGGVTTQDAALAEKIRELSNYGSKQKYLHESAGANCRLDPVQAAFLSIKLAQLDDVIARRRRIAAAYSAVIPAQEGAAPFYRMLGEVAEDSVWHNFVICCENRDATQKALTDAGIGTLVHYPLIPALQPCYVDAFGRTVAGTPVAKRNSETVLSLPVGEYMRDDEITHVVNTLKQLAGA